MDKNKNNNNDHNLDALKDIEETLGVGQEEETTPTTSSTPTSQKSSIIPDVITHQNPNTNELDGYIKLEQYDLPQHGALYPDNWDFAYKCPSTGDVAVFSTLHEQDQPAIMSAIDDIIRKNVYIYDSVNSRLITTGEICDAHKVFFLMKLREFYLSEYPIKIDTICENCHEPYQEDLFASGLEYSDIPQKLLDNYDGRVFTLSFPEFSEQIIIRIPTLDTTSKIFKHIVRVYRDKDKEKKGGTSKANKIFYDKKFLLLAPFLFESGSETIQDIVKKFDEVSKNDKIFKRYNEFITRVHIENSTEIESTCRHCGSPEVAQIKFPTWNKLFVDDRDDSGYYD
jgi:hypothetical protein